MSNARLEINKLFDASIDSDTALTGLMEVLARGLSCDRCLLFLREPHSRKTRMTHQWAASPEHEVSRAGQEWTAESPTLPDEDPMYREALTNPGALYIDDIEKADPNLVNAAYELEHFGHTALIHAPIHKDGLMYGIIEPCVFSGPRVWSSADRVLTALAQERCIPSVVDYIAEHCI